MYTTSFIVILPWLGFTLHGMTHIILFNVGAILALISHFKAMLTDPGKQL